MTEIQMQGVYEKLKTPVKLGPVLWDDVCCYDCPNVFRKEDGSFGMFFSRFNSHEEHTGYETWMASSEDLIHWEIDGQVLGRRKGTWDSAQANGSLALIDTEWGGSYLPQKYGGYYWMSYFGGNRSGYETDPLSIGIARGEAIRPGAFCQGDSPVLSIYDQDVRPFETQTLYKSTIIYDPDKTLEYPFLMFYNAKQQGAWVERIGLAGSFNMCEWNRIGKNSILENNFQDIDNICGDPQIIRMGDLWVMNYFVSAKGTAWNSFACSRNLTDWVHWKGQPLMEPSEPFDSRYAHKPCIINHEGRTYQFYCVVGDRGRCICLAVSEK